ncbi:hypothetical protein GC194_00100 [bacterium]|nr:hypothetical protein [bacterium]
MSEEKFPLLLFVTGRERSGTTLLQHILNLHPEMVVAPESTFIWDLLPMVKRNAQQYFDRPDSFIRLLQKDIRFNLWNLDDKTIREEIAMVARAGNKNFQDLLVSILRAYGLSEGKPTPKIIGIKHPSFAMFLPELLAVFPEAHVLHIVRDYRDVLHSMLQLPFETKNVFTINHRWVNYNRTYRKVAEKAAERCTALRYEDLVQNPERTLSPFLENHGLKWQNEMLHVAQYIRHKPVNNLVLNKYQKHLTMPISSQLIGAGKAALTARQLKIAESICGKLGLAYGYEMTTDQPKINAAVGALTRLWASLYFRAERFSNRLLPFWKIRYLNFKNFLAAGWHKDLSN